jgi:hypothetical protein
MNVAQFFLGKNGAPTNAAATNLSKTTVPTYYGTTNNASSKVWLYMKQSLSYVFGIGIVLFIIMLFIHFFITPVFSAQPGAPGILTVPGLDKGELFWNKSSPEMIPNNLLPIHNMEFGYSFILDIFIVNPHVHFSKHPRILFRRGGTLRATPTGDTLSGMIDNYNIVGALLPDTNDLLISVLNASNNTENIIIPNIPVQEPFRLGVILMNQAMEVYINGHLMKTRAFTVPPKSVHGDFYPLGANESSMAKLQNLKIWPSILTSPEIRYAKPNMPSATELGSPMPQTGMCSSSSGNTNVPGFDVNTGNRMASRSTISGRAFLNTMS